MKIEVGQVWREVDPRFARFVVIESVGSTVAGNGIVGIRTVIRRDARWVNPPRSRAGTAKASRFDGKRGGYEFAGVVS